MGTSFMKTNKDADEKPTSARGAARSLIDPAHRTVAGWEPSSGEAPLLLGCAADMVAQVSSLWTPGGEHRVPDDRDAAPADDVIDDDLVGDDRVGVSEAELRAELDEARRRLADVPAAQVVANHAMGLFELAAIHLSHQPPQLGEASVAIDAMAALVESLGDRLGSNASVLRDALAQIRMAYVQVKGGQAGESATAS
jgi:hypothetical protein